MAKVKNKNVIVIELTCCFETNFEKSRQYKTKRYEDVRNDCIIENTSLTKNYVKMLTWCLNKNNKTIDQLVQSK